MGARPRYLGRTGGVRCTGAAYHSGVHPKRAGRNHRGHSLWGLGGLLICLVGCVVASTGVFLLSKRFGAPLLKRVFGEHKLEEYTNLKNAKKLETAVFILFLILGTHSAPVGKVPASHKKAPFTPHDALLFPTNCCMISNRYAGGRFGVEKAKT